MEQKTTNLLDLILGAETSGTIYSNTPIYRQVLKLKGYRIEFDTDAHAESSRFIKIQSPMFSSNSFNTASNEQTDTTSNGLVIFPEKKITVQHCDIPVMMAKNMNKSFNYNLVSDSLTGFQSLHLIFEYEIQQIV